MTRNHSPVAGRTLVVCLTVLLSLILPAPVSAQDAPAPAVSDTFGAEADAGQADVDISWTITRPDELWRLEAVGPPGETVRLELLGPDGRDLGRSHSTDAAVLFDRALSPDTYTIRLRRGGVEPFGVTLAAGPEDVRYDPEPNDLPETAIPLGDGVEVTGRLAGSNGDEDLYALVIPSGDSNVRTVTLTSSSELERELCLSDTEDQPLQCRRAAGAVSLSDLVLEPGSYHLRVRGSADEEAGYTLRVDQVGTRAPDREAEPNDEFERASAFDAALGVEGSSSREDYDFHAVTIEGEPQLWRIEASGAEVDQLAWVRGGRTEIASSRPACDGSSAVLEDLYLVPGTHRFMVRSCSGDYRIEMTPQGPRDPEAEREPNNDDVRAEAYAVGERRIGRLATADDLDYYRFTLAAPEHLGLRLTQPADADVDVRLRSGGIELFRQRALEPGAALDVELWLRPGDYLLALRPLQPSEGVYEFSTERLDPFVIPADVEPNHDPGFARPAPASLRWQGDAAGGNQDVDAWWLPALGAPGPITVRVDTERPVLRLFGDAARSERIDLAVEEDGTFVAMDAPVGVPLFLELQAEGPYSLELEAPGWPAQDEALAPAVEITLALEEDQVAAYWPQGQRASGAITLVNAGAEDLELALQAATSHYAWQLRPDQADVSLPAGATATIPVELDIQPDVWADAPVRLSVAAVAPNGGLQSASTVIDAGQDAEAVGSRTAWPVPDALLGGLNVAGQALGGKPTGSLDLDREAFLYDGFTPAGLGFGLPVETFPLEIVVDLAGDEPVPVAGTILNPLAHGSRLDSMVRDFELLLSGDGETWRSVLEGELQPLPIDQSYVLAEPVAATHAMLRVHSLHGDGRGRFAALGEWKVVAAPGALPDVMPTNIADPVRGGHVARHAPFRTGFDHWYGILDEDDRLRTQGIDRNDPEGLELVIGFREGRAAQIRELRWQDPQGSVEDERAPQVDVSVSLDGPLGPWEGLGTWVLERAPDGSVPAFELARPTWARYVRLQAPTPPEGVREVEFPARVEVIERATDDEYRSILGEWGYTSDAGPYEWLVPIAINATEPGADAGDTATDATPLELGQRRADRVEIFEDVDWYRVEVPTDANTLTIEVEGVPSAGVRLSLFDAAAIAQQMRSTVMAGGALRYEAAVEPGAAYDILVEQPPFNVVFTFDTSGSMGPYLDFVLEGMRVFASDVRPGREAAMIVPFEQLPLLDVWQDQPLLLEDAVNAFERGDDSSNVERGLRASAELLRDREGVRAILVVADAETTTLAEAPQVWAAFEEVQPVVYAVHVGADVRPRETRDLMRAWTDANGGVYSYPTTHAEMERSFERMSTRLRRPATYTLLATASHINRDPASLSVVAAQGQPAALAPGVGIGIILDTSGSMRKGIDGVRRIEIAKVSMRELLTETLAEGVPLAIRTFGGKGKGAGCETRLPLPLAPLDREAALRFVRKLDAPKKASTPIAAALSRVPDDLADVEGSRIVVLVTDGAESCGGDPEAAIAALREGGFEVNLNIVGFALDDEEVKAQMAGWAAAGDGSYFDATSAAELAEAISTAVSAPFRVYAADGETGAVAEPIASGIVGGGPVTVEPGSYRVEVLSDPMVTFEQVVLGGGENVSLELPDASAPDEAP